MIENQNTEFKQIWKDDYLKSICAFANAQGGKLYIGVNDKGSITGVNNYKKLLEDLPNKIRNILGVIPQINHKTENHKSYLEIVIEPYNNPISFRGHFYYRSGSTIQELNGPSLEKFLLNKKGKKWDGVVTDEFSLNDLSQTAFDIFRKKAGLSKRVPKEDLSEDNRKILDLLGLLENDKLTRASILSFGKDPEKLITGAYVKIGFFRTHTNLLYQDEIHGSLFEQIEKTMELLLTKYLKASIAYEGLSRTETFDYPVDALREAVLNALIHKDYSSGNPVQISVYSNMLWISNEGKLPQGWTIKTLLNKHKSVPPNPDIAKTFFRAGYIETWGRGTINIIENCKKAGLPAPDFRYDAGLTVLFKKENKSFEELSSPEIKDVEKDAEKDVEKDVEKLSKNEKLIYNKIKNNPKITAKELSEVIGINPRNIQKHIQQLKIKKMIERIGPDKGGYWKTYKKN